MLKSAFTVDGIPVAQLTDGSEKRVELICDSCGQESVTIWHNYVQYQRKKGWTGETTCQRCAVHRTIASNRGRRNPATAARNASRRGAKHPCWRGGRYISSDGYVMVLVQSGHAHDVSGWKQYRREHIVVMESAVGRKLTTKEVVHHVDLDKEHNLLDNLWLTNQPGHRQAHVSLQDLAGQMVRQGLLGFDKELGIYFVADLKLRELLEQPGEANQQPSPDGNDREGSETRERVLPGQ